ncbi:MAG TPA: hypothetical protein VMR28_01475 [Candidatus Saccharimonadales bacterium]|nr:hypothetical protein [Candidatus Saccharimonadales bacterium]
MRQIVAKLKPTGGFSHAFHLGLVVLLPILIFILVRLNNGFIQVALAIILLSKWRMFAVRPRYWGANIQANAVDIIVGISTLIFMVHTSSALWQLVWAALYGAWLVGIKPNSSVIGMISQALIGQVFGLMALFIEWPAAPLYGLVAGAGIVCYASARHFFESFDEPYTKLLAYTWGYFGAALTWVLGHFLLSSYGITYPALLLTVIGFGLAALYYLDHYDRLSDLLRREFILVTCVIVGIVLVALYLGSRSKVV